MGLGAYASSQQTIRARAMPGSLARRFRCRGLGFTVGVYGLGLRGLGVQGSSVILYMV